MATSRVFPESVPILTADDMRKRAYCSDDGRMCLLGRFCSVFEGCDSNTEIDDFVALHDKSALVKKFEKFVEDHPNARPVSGFLVDINDNIPLAQSAEIWNDFVKSIGYTQISMEAAG